MIHLGLLFCSLALTSACGASTPAASNSAGSAAEPTSASNADDVPGPTKVANYDPCAKLQCGQECRECPPDDEDCVETDVVKQCSSNGKCLAEVAECR